MRTKYIVAIYETNRAFGGREEGGWWFDCGTLKRVICVSSNLDAACKIARRLNRTLDYMQRDQPGIDSVICDGHLSAEVHDDNAPAFYPDRRPHYE